MKFKIGFFSIMLFLSLVLSRSCFALMAFLAAAIHELSHVFAARMCGIRFTEFKIGIYGAGLSPVSNSFSYRDEIVLCALGPMSNFICALIGLLLLRQFPSLVLKYFIFASISLGTLNILPIKDFDGGRILNSLLCIYISPYLSEKIVYAISFVFIFILWCFSVYFLLVARSTLSMFIFSISLFSRIFIKEN